ncbi:hypothetical protein [Mesorhizobium sp. 131-3-5]|uniref:hypothetical protein n=1 Tax=Mesorhizobium sp. 131-3-5 TaxID=2744520 RepID=UPI001925BB1A|nr:hypothetical protein [Mesorhizobium sp. 131-3-5]
MAEVIEVACRDFLEAAQASGDLGSYIRTRSAHHKIVAYELDIENLPTRAATLYIVGAYQQLESFLIDLIEESDEVCGRKSRERTDKEAALDWALDVLPGGKAANLRKVRVELYAILEYYRAVRNRFMHTRKKASGIDKALKEVDYWSPVYAVDFGLKAPNEPDALILDDFLLFTRAIKYVATHLCRVACPTPDEVVAHAGREMKTKALRNLDWHMTDDQKARRKLAQHYQVKYRYDLTAVPHILDDVIRLNKIGAGRIGRTFKDKVRHR